MTGVSSADLLEALQRLPLLTPQQTASLAALPATGDAQALSADLVERGWLTAYQGKLLVQGRGRELVLDQFVLLDLIGQGGMGSVFRARQLRMNRLVALKVIRKEVLESPQAIERFQREGAAAARLSHPNVVHVYDANQVEGVPFLVMEYIEGVDLARLIRDRAPLAVPSVCDWVRQAALGLQHAHEQGLIHRDIKPHNLMLDRHGVVKVMDLGLARAVGTAESETAALGLTGTGTVVGTPDYLAPEQAQDAKRVDIRADIYSLGCTLYHLLAGRVPFTGTSVAEKLVKHQLHQPDPIEKVRAEVPAALASVVQKMMAKEPAQRYQTPAEVAGALLPFATPGAYSAAIPLARALIDPASASTDRTPVTDPATRETVDGRQPLSETLPVNWRAQALPLRPRWLIAVGTAVLAGMLLLALGLWALFGKAPAPPPGLAATRPPTTAVSAKLPPATQAVSPKVSPPANPTVRTNSIGMKLVQIPRGVFTMGSPRHGIDEAYRFANEELHEVEISQPFWLGVFEVTQAEYTRVMGSNPSSFAAGGESSQSVVDQDTRLYPVENVTWHEAVEFCRKLSNQPEELAASRVYRLPTEAEWEYACRAGAKSYTMYHFGNTITHELANFRCNEPFPPEASSKNPVGRPRTVGSYAPNAFGLYDMHGNVWEWCSDWFGTYDPAQRLDPAGPPTGVKRIIRGGSWNNTFVGNRAATRASYEPAAKTSIYGFRVVCTMP